MRELIIVGSGIAGMTAAIYAARARIDTVIIEKESLSGGQANYTAAIDNYPGLPGISGRDLSERIRGQVQINGVEILQDRVVKVEKGLVTMADGHFLKTRAVLIATGAENRRLGVRGEEKLLGHGVSYCAHCDASFFKDKNTAVIGGGNSAMSEAIHLSRLCKRVYLIVRSDRLKGERTLMESIKSTTNITVKFNSVIDEIVGVDTVEAIRLANNEAIAVDGVFIAIGRQPVTDIVESVCQRDEAGYIITDRLGVTSESGIFAAGDCIRKEFRQLITAAADGAICVKGIQTFLLSLIQ